MFFLRRSSPWPILTAREVVISLETADAQAGEDGLRAELRVLLTHGLLHLLGYDHETPEDHGEMAAAERKLLRRLGWTGEGLITRVTGQRLHDDAPVLRRPPRSGQPAMTAVKAREGLRGRERGHCTDYIRSQSFIPVGQCETYSVGKWTAV